MMINEKYPIIVGGIGGSGTRVIVDILQNAGYYFGNNLNNSNDAMSFVPIYEQWIPKILEEDMSEIDNKILLDEIQQSIATHKKGIISDTIPWGWKNPRSIYLLKFFKKLYPDMKFIHIIRDGRDMAFSSNQNQVIKYGQYILTPEELCKEPYLQSIIFWDYMNMTTNKNAEEYFKKNYIYIKIEDLWKDTDLTIKRICDFCNISTDNLSSLSKLVTTPKSIERWKTKGNDKISAMNLVGMKALNYFDYN